MPAVGAGGRGGVEGRGGGAAVGWREGVVHLLLVVVKFYYIAERLSINNVYTHVFTRTRMQAKRLSEVIQEQRLRQYLSYCIQTWHDGRLVDAL